ncbi:hypothetical protein [Dolichospermum phage Dfl-JY45]
MNTFEFYLQTPFGRGLDELFRQAERALGLSQPVDVYVAGGMAVHLYTGVRVTADVDAEFGCRVLLPAGLSVSVDDGSDLPLGMYFDTNYNPMFSLLHEDYQRDAVEVPLGLRYFRVRVLAPVDLALSKVARYAENDRQDIAALAAAGLVSSEALSRRGEEALVAYIGNTQAAHGNLESAVACVRAVEAAGHFPTPFSR